MHKFCKDEGYESSPSGMFGIAEVLIRYTKGVDLMQSDDDLLRSFRNESEKSTSCSFLDNSGTE